MPIPKIIIQTWKTRDLPEYYKKSQNLIFTNNPEYRYIFFDDDDIDRFIRDRFPSFQSVITKFKRKIQVIDLFRLLAVYEYGGFYFDMDVEIVDNLDPLLQYECVFPIEMMRDNKVLNKMGYNYNIGNYAFGASPRNQVIWNIIQAITKVQEDPAWLSPDKYFITDTIDTDLNAMYEYVYHTTGPVIVSKVVFDSLAEGESVKLLYPRNWPSRSSWFKFGTYGKHTMTGTWKPKYENKNIDSKPESNLESFNSIGSDSSIFKKIYEGFGLSKAWNAVKIEHMSDLVSDPESVLIICLISAILVILLVICLISMIGCDDYIEIPASIIEED